MSAKDRLGRHWRVKGNQLQAVYHDGKQKEVSVEMPLVFTKSVHRCGGKIAKIAGLPRAIGDRFFCAKCSAELKRGE